MSLDIQGILNSFQLATETRTVLMPYIREIFINETPLLTRLPHTPIGAPEYNILAYDVRQRPLTLTVATTAVTAGTVSTLTLTDVSQLQVGDVLELYNTANSAFERVEITADPNVSAGTISALRGVEGTTPLANDATTTPGMLLVGNSRLGNEVNQTAFRSIRAATPQYVQTFQYAVQVGGLAQAIEEVQLPAGISDVFSLEQKTKMTEFVRDIEYTTYYGVGQSANPASGFTGAQRRKQAGLRKQFLAGNVKLGAGASYTKLNLVADTVQKCLNGGGDPDVLLVSTDVGATGLATWSFAQQQFMNPEATPYLGVPIRQFVTSITGQPMMIVPSFQLRKGTVVAMTSKDIKMRRIREAFFQKRGLRGDAWEGDFIGDYCVEVGHPAWHAWVEGITSFA